MRVLGICQEDPEWILGGMGRHCRELYREMATRGGVEVDFLTTGPTDGMKPYLGFTKHHGEKLISWRPQGPDMTSLKTDDWQRAMTLARLLADGKKWDVVHCHEWNSYELARMAAHALQVPLVGTMHLCITHLTHVEAPDCYESLAEWPEQEFYLRALEGKLAVETDAFIVCSKAYERIIRETFLTDRPINMIYNGINRDEWNLTAGDGERARAKYDIPADRPVALYAGRIATMKGIEVLLDVIEAVDLGCCCVVSGAVNANSTEAAEGWHVTKRLRRVEQEHPERLRWVDFTFDQDLKDLYRLATVVVMPSTHEPFGLVSLEAMAMGVPLIATDRDGLGEVVIDSDGTEYAMIVDAGSSRSLAAGILDVLGSKDIQQELTALGLARADAFTWGNAVDQTLGVYEQMISRVDEIRQRRYAA